MDECLRLDGYVSPRPRRFEEKGRDPYDALRPWSAITHGVGAALAVAALGAEGESVLSGLGHIDRGYADLAGDLTALGAKIVRKEEK